MADNIDNVNDTESGQTNTGGNSTVAPGVGGEGTGTASGVIESGQLEVSDLTLPVAEDGIANSIATYDGKEYAIGEYFIYRLN